jgi:hypothetical protein
MALIRVGMGASINDLMDAATNQVQKTVTDEVDKVIAPYMSPGTVKGQPQTIGGYVKANLAENWPGILAIGGAGYYAAKQMPRHRGLVIGAAAAAALVDAFAFSFLPTTKWIYAKTGVALPGAGYGGLPVVAAT